jgi:hypothetical protein
MPEIDHQTRGAIGCPQAGTEPCYYPDCKCHSPVEQPAPDQRAKTAEEMDDLLKGRYGY